MTIPTCPPGTVQVGITTVRYPEGDKTCIICKDCPPPADPDCFPPLPETCPGNSFTFTIIANMQGYSFLGGCNGFTGLAGELVGTFTVTKYLLNTDDINWLVLPASAGCDGSHAGLPNQYILRQGTGPYYNLIWSSGTVSGKSEDYWVGGPPAWYAVCTNP